MFLQIFFFSFESLKPLITPRPHERKKHEIFKKIARFFLKTCGFFLNRVFSQKKSRNFLEKNLCFFSRVDKAQGNNIFLTNLKRNINIFFWTKVRLEISDFQFYFYIRLPRYLYILDFWQYLKTFFRDQNSSMMFIRKNINNLFTWKICVQIRYVFKMLWMISNVIQI